MPACQGVRAFWLLPVGWMPIRSLMWRGTNSAIPGWTKTLYLIFLPFARACSILAARTFVEVDTHADEKKEKSGAPDGGL